MLYHYVASDKNGKMLEADVDAENVADVLSQLAAKELRPVRIKASNERKRTMRGIWGGIKTTDKIFLTRYLSLMLSVGTDLLSAINILLADLEKPAMRNLLLEVRENLVRGRPLYEVFARYEAAFSSVFVNLIKAAEASGNLEKTFARLSTSLQREAELKGRIRSAMIYPVILLIASIFISLFLIVFALPRMAAVFLESGIKPPLFSRVVFGVGLFVNDNLLIIGSVVVFIVIPALFFLVWTTSGRRILSSFLTRLPVVRNIYRDMAIHQFSSTFSALMRAGLPILETVKITADVVSEEAVRGSLRRIADEGLAKGLTIGEAFRREMVFPRTVTNLIAVSEKSGHLEEMLETLSEFYATNVDGSVRTAVAILEPVLLIFMGLFVGSIAIAIIVPIYQLASQF